MAKSAASDLLSMQLRLAYQHDGVQVLHDLLCEEINNKSRVANIMISHEIKICNWNIN